MYKSSMNNGKRENKILFNSSYDKNDPALK